LQVLADDDNVIGNLEDRCPLVIDDYIFLEAEDERFKREKEVSHSGASFLSFSLGFGRESVIENFKAYFLLLYFHFLFSSLQPKKKLSQSLSFPFYHFLSNQMRP